MSIFWVLSAALPIACGDSGDQPQRSDRGFRPPVLIDPDDAGVSNHPCGLRVESALEVTLEVYTSSAAWAARLVPCVRRIGFDDVVAVGGPAPIDAERYANEGLVLTAPNGGGQFVHPDFGVPQDFRAVSLPNVFAPGPRNTPNSLTDRGGYRTTATFVEGATPASVAGFGAFFLDTDYPDIRLSGLTAFDARHRPLGPPATVSGASGSRLFLGVVSVLGDVPVAAIHSVELETGDGWVGAPEINEVVALDDVMFGVPATP